MLKLKLCSLCAMALLFLTINANGQNIDDVNVSLLKITNSDSTVTASAFLLVNDTINISEIEVKIGTQTSNGDLANHTFTFDDSTSLSSPLSYQRIGNSIYLSLGIINVNSTYFGSIRTKDLSGNFSSPFEFIFN